MSNLTELNQMALAAIDTSSYNRKLIRSILQIAVEATLGVFYLFVVSIIVTSKRKVFYNAFYILFIATGLTDILAICLSIFFRLNRHLGFGPEVQGIVSFCATLGALTFFGHMIGNMIIALNRYSALCLLNTYDKIWRRKNVWIIVGLQYVVAFIAASPLVGVQIVYTRNADGTYAFVGMEERADLMNKYIGVGICVTYTLVSVAVNIRLAVEWHRLSRYGKSSRYSRQEKALLLYTLAVFGSSLLMCAWQILKVLAIYTNNDNFEMLVLMQWFWVNDVMLSIPPLFILLLSADLRQEIVNIVRCKNRVSGAAAIIATRTKHHSATRKDSNSNIGKLTNVASVS